MNNIEFNEGHRYNADGELEGLYTVDGKKAREVHGNSNFWEGVKEVIRYYTEINPSEMKYCTLENSIQRETNKNETGGNDSGSMRQALSLPHGLHLALTDYEPRLFRDKKMRTEFMKRFPHLRTCNKV